MPVTSQPGLESKTTGIVLGRSECKNRDKIESSNLEYGLSIS